MKAGSRKLSLEREEGLEGEGWLIGAIAIAQGHRHHAVAGCQRTRESPSHPQFPLSLGFLSVTPIQQNQLKAL